MDQAQGSSTAIVVGFREQLGLDVGSITCAAGSRRILELPTLEDAFGCLADSPEISLAVACLDSRKLSDLYHVQTLRQQCTSMTLLALFDVWVSPEAARRTAFGVLNEFVGGTDDNELLQALQARTPGSGLMNAPQESPDALGYRLTPRQCDVLYLVREGRSNKEIARKLDLSEGTVKIHCMALFRTLGVANRTQAAILAEKFLLEAPVSSTPSTKRYVDIRALVG